jgi:hypothetical protein
MPEAHSLYSASRFEADMLCPGRRTMEKGLPDSSSIYAARGTVAHSVLEAALRDGFEPSSFIGQSFKQDGFDIEFDDALCENVDIAVKNIKELTAGADVFEAESRVNYASWLNVPEADAWGTADVKGIKGQTLYVHDFKNGHNPVPADSVQLKLYAGGTLSEYDDIADIEHVMLVIHQPEVSNEPIMYGMPVQELKEWLIDVARPAVVQMQKAAERHGKISQAEWEAAFLSAGANQCKYCKARATCPTARQEALEPVLGQVPATADEFAGEFVPHRSQPADAPDEWLSAIMDKADTIEDWLKAVRAEVERRLLAGTEVTGWKVVQGKRGNRAWADPAVAEATLKTMRLKIEEMYQLKLITPTAAEKLAPKPLKKGAKPDPEAPKTPIGARQWAKLQELITRADGKAYVAPASDPRPALQMTPIADEFEDVGNDDIA